jgi:Lrp/AsnC family leucine-responsive transcriptional regulator
VNNGIARTQPAHGLKIDETDRRIIGELISDGRVSFDEHGRRVNLSPPTVAERVQRHERPGLITVYMEEIHPRSVGYPLTAFVRVKPAARQLPRIGELAAEIPEVGECHRITGEDCFILKVHLRSIDDLGALHDRFLVFGETTTSRIAASPIARGAAPIVA